MDSPETKKNENSRETLPQDGTLHRWPCVEGQRENGRKLLPPRWHPLQTTWGGERAQREKRESTATKPPQFKITLLPPCNNQQGTRAKQKENLESLEAGTGSTAGTHGGTLPSPWQKWQAAGMDNLASNAVLLWLGTAGRLGWPYGEGPVLFFLAWWCSCFCLALPQLTQQEQKIKSTFSGMSPNLKMLPTLKKD